MVVMVVMVRGAGRHDGKGRHARSAAAAAGAARRERARGDETGRRDRSGLVKPGQVWSVSESPGCQRFKAPPAPAPSGAARRS